MTTKYVKFCMRSRLPCANASVQDVILCLQDAALVVQPVPACGLDITTIEATICQAFTLGDACQNPIWNYTFSYDDAQLTSPSTGLTSADITGVFCKDCLTTWIEEQISCAADGGITCVADSSTIDFSIDIDGCATGSVILSPDANNILAAHGNGLYATAITSLSVLDTATIDFILTGTQISGSVKISADGGNTISAHADGIYSAGGGSGWSLLGNAGTVDGTNFLGTTDNIPFTLRVNNISTWRVNPPATGGTASTRQPDFLGNSSFNIITGGMIGRGNVICGGGESSHVNWYNSIIGAVADQFGHNFIGSGYFNQHDTSDTSFIGTGHGNLCKGGTVVGFGLDDCAIVAGNHNEISCDASANAAFESAFIGAGVENLIQYVAYYAFIGAGQENTITALNATGAVDGGTFAAIVAGTGNTVLSSAASFIGAGDTNIITGLGASPGGGVQESNFIGAGTGNSITNVKNAFIGSGTGHAISYSPGSFIGAGDVNTITGPSSGTASFHNVIGGGQGNIISCNAATLFDVGTIAGGYLNLIQYGSDGAFIGGGWSNHIIAIDGTGTYVGGEVSSVVGGESNVIISSAGSLIGGGKSNNITGAGVGRDYNVILEGFQNGISGADYAVILGGHDNHISGSISTILGGSGLTLGANSVGFNAAANTLDRHLSTGQFFTNNLDWVLANTDSTARAIYFYEPNADLTFGSTNVSSIQAQAQGANIFYVLPAAAGTAGQVLTIDTVVGSTVTLKWA